MLHVPAAVPGGPGLGPERSRLPSGPERAEAIYYMITLDYVILLKSVTCVHPERSHGTRAVPSRVPSGPERSRAVSSVLEKRSPPVKSCFKERTKRSPPVKTFCWVLALCQGACDQGCSSLGCSSSSWRQFRAWWLHSCVSCSHRTRVFVQCSVQMVAVMRPMSALSKLFVMI
jgi:hypothetical protein